MLENVKLYSGKGSGFGYSDNFISYSLKNAYNLHKQNQRSLTLSVCPKIFGNIVLDDNGIVQKYDNSRNNEEFKYVEIGYMIVNRDQMLSFFTNPKFF